MRAAQLAQAEGIAEEGTEEGLFSLASIKVRCWLSMTMTGAAASTAAVACD